MARDETRIYDQRRQRGPLLKGKNLTLFWLGVNLEYIRLASYHRYSVKMKNHILDNLKYAKKRALKLHLQISVPESLTYWIRYLERTYVSEHERIDASDGDTLSKEISNLKSLISRNVYAPNWYAFWLGINIEYLKRAAYHKYTVLDEHFILGNLKAARGNLKKLKISGEPMNAIDNWIRYLGGKYRVFGEKINDIDADNLYRETEDLIEFLGG
ncbi:MAG: hypothetical protein AYK19_10580 [Theionarchaea archaeon DG-70-1]|nr:MAG: hypothetical protein AYK19_10580 [Theionarchaea archaeon DG-70-1]